jgi:uncharacterized membrane protein
VTALDAATKASDDIGTGSARIRSRLPEYLTLGLLTAAFFAFYAIYALSRYKTYLTTGYDLGIFDQAVRAYSHFHAPIVPLKGPGYNVLGDHFHPIIATIAPLYWIWDSPCVLLIVQAALLAASIPVVYKFAHRRTGVLVSLVICASYGIGWAFQAMIDFDFHEVAFAVPLMALAIDALDRRADRQLLICAGLLLLVREDMGALLMVLGILRLLGRGDRPKWPGIALIASGAAGYVLATSVIIPAFAQDHNFDYWQYQQLGPNLPSALVDIVIHPWHAVKAFFLPSEKSQTLAYLFVPLALLPLRSRYVFIVVPLLAEQFFNSRSNLWGTHFHYSALPWTILSLAMIDGAARLNLFKWLVTKSLLAAWLVIVPIWMVQYDTVTPAAARRLIKGVAFTVTPEERSESAVVAMIPADTCDAVDDHLAPHLTRRDYVSLADGQRGTADFIGLDFKYDSIGGNVPVAPDVVYATARADGYQTIYYKNGVMLLQSPHYAGPSSACSPFGSGK